MVSRKLSSSVTEGGLDGWQLEYESALQETDRKTLFKRVEIAEAAILTRREAVTHSPDGFVEGQEIKIALDTLSKLKKEVLKFL
jgi:pterin-4a-carbinolamine dehydratase